jgi:mono/diheme cytochrome c family protein
VKAFALILVLIIGSYVFYKHSGFFLYEQNVMQYMPNMHHTVSLRPQRGYDFYSDRLSARTPPAGTLAVNQKPYPYSKEKLAADVEKYSNPLPVTKESLLRGQKVFMNTCVVCHGASGNGDGYIVPPFSKPPSLQSEKIRAYADSQIFHVITVGQNLMGSYAPQIREQDRWAVIHYLRALQKAENPTEADISAFDTLVNSGKKGEGEK